MDSPPSPEELKTEGKGPVYDSGSSSKAEAEKFLEGNSEMWKARIRGIADPDVALRFAMHEITREKTRKGVIRYLYRESCLTYEQVCWLHRKVMEFETGLEDPNPEFIGWLNSLRDKVRTHHQRG